MKAVEVVRPAEAVLLYVVQLIVEIAACGDCVCLSECHDAHVYGVDVADDNISH